MKEFTVVLRVPDYEAQDWPEDLYIAHLSATGIDEAGVRAQRMAADDFGKNYDEPDDTELEPEDFKILLVTPQVQVLQRGDVL